MNRLLRRVSGAGVGLNPSIWEFPGLGSLRIDMRGTASTTRKLNAIWRAAREASSTMASVAEPDPAAGRRKPFRSRAPGAARRRGRRRAAARRALSDIPYVLVSPYAATCHPEGENRPQWRGG